MDGLCPGGEGKNDAASSRFAAIRSVYILSFDRARFPRYPFSSFACFPFESFDGKNVRARGTAGRIVYSRARGRVFV